jgi:general secretion pathway protein A
MTPDPGFLYQTQSHREALAALTYGVLQEKGFITVIGDAGTGKTTLLSRMLRTIPGDKVAFSLVLNPTLSCDEFLESALVDFGIEAVPDTKVRRLLKLQQFLGIARSAGRICVLVADEAHKLSTAVLEEIRLLTNFENAERKLLQIILSGQPELRATLNAEELRQLKQRIAVRCELRPLSDAEVAQYMHFRWATAGGGDDIPFDKDAIQFIAGASRGIPRVINALCDNALTLIYATGEGRVTGLHAQQVAGDLDLGGAESYTPTTPQRTHPNGAPGGHPNGAAGHPNGAPRHPPLNLPRPVAVTPFKEVRGISNGSRLRRSW